MWQQSNVDHVEQRATNRVGARVRVVLCALLVAGCGAPPVPVEAPAPSVVERLPDPPRGSLWGDGYGPTAREAVLDARRAVSEQVVAKMSSEVETQVAESGGKAERDARQHVRTQSAFGHVELLVTLGVVEQDGGFIARVGLDRRRALEVYGDELREADERVLATQPGVDAALGSLDTSVLLVAENAPGHHLATRSRVARVLAVLGHAKGMVPPDAAVILERKASKLRRTAVLRLSVKGDVPAAVRDAATGAIARQLEARGCQVVAPDYVLAEDVPAADAVLRLQTRDHLESGLKWRYLGLAIEVVDARSARPVFRYVALPDFVHAGGPSWPQADKALARRLGARLAEKAAADFARLTCR